MRQLRLTPRHLPARPCRTLEENLALRSDLVAAAEAGGALAGERVSQLLQELGGRVDRAAAKLSKQLGRLAGRGLAAAECASGWLWSCGCGAWRHGGGSDAGVHAWCPQLAMCSTCIRTARAVPPCHIGVLTIT